MMTANEFDWSSAPLSAEDEALVEAYNTVGVPVDALPYTDAFDNLLKQLGLPVTKENQRATFRRLLSLRKRALLPRIYTSAATVDD